MIPETLTNPYIFLKEYSARLESLCARRIKREKLTDNLIIKEDGNEKSYSLKRDGKNLMKTRNPSLLIPYLEWEIFHAYINEISEDLSVFHAASVVKDKKAILLVGGSGNGKTTLTVALIKRGFSYLTDDHALIHPETLKVLPAPKAIHLKGKSLQFFPSLSPEFVPVPYPRGFFPGISKALCCFPKKEILTEREDAFRVHLIFFLRREEAIELQPLPKGHAGVQLFEHSLKNGKKDFLTSMRLAKKAKAFLLPVGELKATCSTIEQLLFEEKDWL